MEAKHRTEINFAIRHAKDFPVSFPDPDLEYLKDWELIRELMSRGYRFDDAAPDLLKALKELMWPSSNCFLVSERYPVKITVK